LDTGLAQTKKTRAKEKRDARSAPSSKAGLLLCGGLSVRVFLLKALHASRGVYKLLLSGEKRVAVRADFDAQHVTFDGGARRKRVAASTVHGYGVIIGVNSGFHDSPF
jgi:hypothetical protein